MDHRLAIEIEHPDGSRDRWGPDEIDPENVPIDKGFTTSMPGGDETFTLTLPRRVDTDYADLGLRDRIRAYGPGNETAWGPGLQAEFPRQHDTAHSISVGAVGKSAKLRDFRNFQEVYVDRDPASWAGMPLARRIALAATIPVDVDYTASADKGLAFNGVDGKAITTSSRAELFYLASAAVKLAKLMYRGTEANTANVSAPSVVSDDNLEFSSGATTALTLDDTLRTATFTAERYLKLAAIASATHTPAAGSPFRRQYSKIAAYGDHGLTTRAITGEPDGIWLSDIVEHIVRTAAPDLAYTTGPAGSIEPDEFVVPHFVPLHMTGEAALLQVNKWAFADWGVYDDLFFWRQPDPDKLTWDCRLSGGAGMVLEGDQAEDLYNGVVVRFQDFDGETRTAGPPGSGCDYENAALLDTDPANPLNEWGEVKWGELELSHVTYSVSAIQTGQVWLAEAKVPKRRGQLVFHGTATHPTKGERPAWAIRAGDWARIVDHPASVPRRIIKTTYTHRTQTLNADLDNTPHLVEALLEIMGVSQVGIL